MNNLQIFQNQQFGSVRTIERGNNILFVAKDVCDCLDINNSRQALSRLDSDEKNTVILNDGNRGNPTVSVVTEAGLYTLILSSRKPEAHEFKRWITHDVIPSIRRNGAYMTDKVLEKTLEDPDYLIGLLKRMKEEKAKRLEAERRIELDRPKVTFANAVTTSKTSILVGDLAKILRGNGINIGQKRLFQWLRNNGYLIKQKGTSYNMPTQYSMELGLFKIKEGSYIDANGVNVITKTPKVTGKGQQYFINRLVGGAGA